MVKLFARGALIRAARKRVGYPAALCALWVAMILVINPLGDFPLNDDWAYGLAVRDLIDKHAVVIPPWTSASLVAQTFYGLLFCLPFGFSFTVLRIATGALGLVAVLATYGLARETGGDRRTSFVCAAALAVNPLVFQCSNTFMTDTPFLAFLLLAFLCALRALRLGSYVEGMLALAAALAAVLTRQLGLLIPLALAGGLLVSRRITLRRSVAIVAGGLVVFAALQLYERWLRQSGQMSSLYGQQARNLVAALGNLAQVKAALGDIRDRMDIALVFSGVLLAPILFVTVPARRRPAGWILAAAALLASGFAIDTCVNLFRRGWRMPFRVGFNLFDIGLGPLTLTDVYFRDMPHFPRASSAFWWAVTAVGIAGGAVLVFLVVASALEFLPGARSTQRKSRGLTPAVALVFLAGYGLVLALLFFFDRYLIPIFPMLAVVAVAGTRPRPPRPWGWWVTSSATLLLIGTFSVAATHDYLAWNRARWAGLKHLTGELGVLPDRIDGGFEFNGLVRYGKDVGADKSWWWVHDDEFVVAFGTMPGYETLKIYEYLRMIPPGKGKIYVLKRQP